MAFIADIVSILASGLTVLALVAYAAFHQDILLKILQRGLAYQAFFLHDFELIVFHLIKNKPLLPTASTLSNVFVKSVNDSHQMYCAMFCKITLFSQI